MKTPTDSGSDYSYVISYKGTNKKISEVFKRSFGLKTFDAPIEMGGWTFQDANDVSEVTGGLNAEVELALAYTVHSVKESDQFVVTLYKGGCALNGFMYFYNPEQEDWNHTALDVSLSPAE